MNCLENYFIDLNNLDQLYQALFYEFMRQFGDKLVNLPSKSTLSDLLKKVFGVELKTYYHLCKETKKLKPLSRAEYEGVLFEYIKNYEKDIKKIDGVLVDEVIDLMAAFEKKVIERGAILLAGSSGTFRKTAAKVVCNAHGL